MARLDELVIVVAVARNGVIGRGNELPWKLRSDLQRFKQMTMGHTLIMGRKTWDSIGRLLPGRTTIVISRSLTFEGGDPSLQPWVARSLQEAVERTPLGQIPMVVGGAEIYREALPYCRQLWLTRVEADIEGDTFFPDWDESTWIKTESVSCPAGERDAYATTFEKWTRKTLGR